MKKLVLSGALAVALSGVAVQVAQARAFVGLDVGYDRAVLPSGNNGFVNEIYRDFGKAGGADGFNVSANIGGEWLFGGYVGLRTFLGLGYGHAYFTGVSLNIIDVNLNLDVLANAYNGGSFSVGLFAGVGAGLGTAARDFSAEAIVVGLNAPIYFRLGASMTLGEHNRIDITTILPMLSYSAVGFAGGFAGLTPEDRLDMVRFGVIGPYNPIRFNIGYKFIF